MSCTATIERQGSEFHIRPRAPHDRRAQLRREIRLETFRGVRSGRVPVREIAARYAGAEQAAVLEWIGEAMQEAYSAVIASLSEFSMQVRITAALQSMTLPASSVRSVA